MTTLRERFDRWYEQQRLHHIEVMLEMLKEEVEQLHLTINKLIREKSQIEISQSRRETT